MTFRVLSKGGSPKRAPIERDVSEPPFNKFKLTGEWTSLTLGNDVRVLSPPHRNLPDLQKGTPLIVFPQSNAPFTQPFNYL